jgi:hypothetical protein
MEISNQNIRCQERFIKLLFWEESLFVEGGDRLEELKEG